MTFCRNEIGTEGGKHFAKMKLGQKMGDILQKKSGQIKAEDGGTWALDVTSTPIRDKPFFVSFLTDPEARYLYKIPSENKKKGYTSCHNLLQRQKKCFQQLGFTVHLI